MRKKIPLTFMHDVIHGYRTIYPINLGLACSFNLDLMRDLAEMSATEAVLDGVNVTFAPMVDLARDARWGRVMETSGEDPYLNCEIAKATVEGFKKGGIATCMKHFAAYGGAVAGKDYAEVDMSEYALREYYLPAYKAAVEAGESKKISFTITEEMLAFYGAGMRRTAERGVFRVFIGKNSDVETYQEFELL